jgi:hypothetical protein
VFLPRVQCAHPTGIVDVPGTVVAAGRDRCAQCILQGAAFKRGIDAGTRNGAGGTRRVIPRQDRTITRGTRRVHQRYSSRQSATHASQTRAMIASVVTKASATNRGAGIVTLRAVGRGPWAVGRGPWAVGRG